MKNLLFALLGLLIVNVASAQSVETAVRITLKHPEAQFVAGTQIGPTQEFLSARLWVGAGAGVQDGHFSGSAAALFRLPIPLQGFVVDGGLLYGAKADERGVWRVDWDGLLQGSLATGPASRFSFGPTMRGGWILGYSQKF